jgi:hypothetical protein
MGNLTVAYIMNSEKDWKILIWSKGVWKRDPPKECKELCGQNMGPM